MKKIIYILLFLLIAVNVQAKPLYEKVKIKRVLSGNLLITEDDRRIRFYGIQVIGLKSQYGSDMKEYLELKLINKPVAIHVLNSNKFKDEFSIVFVELGGDYVDVINLDLLQIGFAKVKRSLCDDIICKEFIKIEELTKKNKVGIWND
jgi:Staphylococcal nuclease homologue.